jgi:peptidoglycan/xylan/chitin deacetylase (PgdA/CDA1 family)
MRYIIYFLCQFALLTGYFWSPIATAANPTSVPILVYHNFDPVKTGSMTLSTKKFEAQIKWLKENGYTIIPLKEFVGYIQGKISSLPQKSVVITDDDGRNSVYTYMLPIVKKYHIPVTLFIYPQVISHASYALTWNQLKALESTGFFDIQGHTFWHPNFKQDKKHMTPAAYAKMVHVQLYNSKDVIDKKLGTKVTLLAWPFGIYNADLEKEAAKAGYTMAFSIDARPANKSANVMAMPRYMIIEGQTMKTFEGIIKRSST